MRLRPVVFAWCLAAALVACGGSGQSAAGGPDASSGAVDGSLPGGGDGGAFTPKPTDGGGGTNTADTGTGSPPIDGGGSGASDGGAVHQGPSGPPFHFDGGWQVPDAGSTPPLAGDGGSTIVLGPGAGSSSPGQFGGASDPASAPTLVYPPDGVLLPPNTLGLEFHFIPAAGQTLFRFTFTAASTTLVTYTGCTSVGGGCVFTPDASFWSNLVAYARGGSPVTFSLSGVNGTTPGTVGTSASQTITFSDQNMTGGLYYWNTSGTIERYDFSQPDAGVERYLMATDVGAFVCVGCHAVSRPGNRIVVGKDVPGPTGDSIVSVPSKSSLLSQTFPSAGNFFSFSPDEWHLLESGGVGVSWLEIGSGTLHSNIAQGTMPDWSPDGEHMVYAKSSSLNPTGVTSGSIATMHFNGTAWDTPTTIVQQASENNYYPAYSPDGNWVAFDRSPANHESYSNATPDPDAGTEPDGELWVVGASGGAPVRLSAASNPGALSWPKWVPVEHTYYGGNIMWVTFSSLRPYGLRLAAGQETQLWMAAVDLTKLASGTDPSFPAFWLPFQDISSGNHIAQWSTAVVRASCTTNLECPSREVCVEGVCEN